MEDNGCIRSTYSLLFSFLISYPAEELPIEGIGLVNGISAVIVVAIGGSNDFFLLPVKTYHAFSRWQLISPSPLAGLSTLIYTAYWKWAFC